LEALKRPCRVEIYTDSNYVKDGITRWIHNWRRNGWRTADRKPVKNAELWQRLDALMGTHDVDWRWVRGHAGHAKTNAPTSWPATPWSPTRSRAARPQGRRDGERVLAGTSSPNTDPGLVMSEGCSSPSDAAEPNYRRGPQPSLG
jgi:hypothetical protein